MEKEQVGLYILTLSLKGIYNISDENLPYTELAQRIIKQFGNKESTIEIVDKGVSSQVRINNEKFMNLVKFSQLD
jgi:hypothetical protein